MRFSDAIPGARPPRPFPLRLLPVLGILVLCLLPGLSRAEESCVLPGDAAAIAAEVGRLINSERSRTNLPPLRASDRLGAAAAAHACDMVRNGYFAHESRSGGTVKDRAGMQGYRACLIAENIAQGYPGSAETHRAWMGSPGHRRNILLPDVREFGLAVVSPESGEGGRRWVLVLGRRCAG